MSDSVHIHVSDIPPSYDAGLSITNPENPQHERYQYLRKEAEKVMAGRPPLDCGLTMRIQYTRALGRADGVNIIGGIANTLQEVVYEDDKQLWHIVYGETAGDEDEYLIEVELSK